MNPHETQAEGDARGDNWAFYQDAEFDLSISGNTTRAWDVSDFDTINVAIDSPERAPTSLAVKVQYSNTGHGWKDSGTTIVHSGFTLGYAETGTKDVKHVRFVRLLVSDDEASETITVASLFGFRS